MAMLLVGREAAAEVYRCEDPEGAVVFQQTPCAEPRLAEKAQEQADDEELPVVTEEAEPEDTSDEMQPAETLSAETGNGRTAEQVEACRKHFRDRIDAVDAQMREGYTDEEARIYKVQLLQLTAKLRAC